MLQTSKNPSPWITVPGMSPNIQRRDETYTKMIYHFILSLTLSQRGELEGESTGEYITTLQNRMDVCLDTIAV